MKRKIIGLVTALALTLFCGASFAAKSSLQNFESMTEANLVYTDPATQNWQECFFLAALSANVTAGLETADPLEGNASMYVKFAADQWQWSGITSTKIGGADWTGFDYLGFKVKNNNPNALVRFYLTVCADGANWTAPSFSEDIQLIDTDNNPVEYTVDPAFGLKIPAGFEGTVFLPLHFTDTDHPAPDTVQYSNVTTINFALNLDGVAETEKIVLDDFALYLENDIPTPAPTSTPTDTVTATPTQGQGSTTAAPTGTTPEPSPETGDPMMIGSVIALCISGAAVVIRKKHS